MSGEHDYSDPKIQHLVENLTQTFENTSYITGALYTESWLRSFLQYTDRNSDYLNVSINNEATFLAELKKVLAPSASVPRHMLTVEI